MLVLVLATRLLPAVKAAVTEPALDWSLHDAFSGSFAPLYHPGSILLLGFAGGALLTGRAALIAPSLAAALRRLLPVALALLVMLGLSRAMVHSGMIETLAASAARTGAAWPLFAPAVGVLGTFVTGSATASNILVHRLPDRHRRRALAHPDDHGRRPVFRRRGRQRHRAPQHHRRQRHGRHP